ncbi:hypothetical protein WJX72_003166 [[Myrmecia] bisecta]|uniref:MYB transcription factor n=1 Tax=[Myrmecia] bisecta TaxID=41462 RepID=A0AAW1Q710_9CHLO
MQEQGPGAVAAFELPPRIHLDKGGEAAGKHAVASNPRPNNAKKGTPWTEEEHALFLQGLRKLGKGNWRGISRFYCLHRTPTQVASHAQKHFLRLSGVTKRRSRFTALEQAVAAGLPPEHLLPNNASTPYHQMGAGASFCPPVQGAATESQPAPLPVHFTKLHRPVALSASAALTNFQALREGLAGSVAQETDSSKTSTLQPSAHSAFKSLAPAAV